MLALVIFLFDKLWEKRPVLVTKQTGITCFKNSTAHQLKIADLDDDLAGKDN